MIDDKLLLGYRRYEALNQKEWPKVFKCRFIQPGLVHYDDMGTVLVERPFLNKIRDSFIGKPVIDEIHKDAKPENFRDVADGVVTRVWTDPADGWDWCEFLVWDEGTMRHCRDKSYSVSCAYTPTRVNEEGGKHNNIEYDGEFLDGVYTHLAIVQDPRYEQARIVLNSQGGMTMFKLFRKKTEEEAVDVNGSDVLEINGEKVSVANALAEYKKATAKPKTANLKDEDLLEIDGQKVSFKDVKNAILNARKKMENAKHDHEDGVDCAKGCPAYNSEGEKGEKAGDQDEAVRKEKEEGKKEDRDNSKDDVEIEKDGKAENSVEKGKSLREFREVAEMRNTEPLAPVINTQSDRLKLGKARYGKIHKEDA